MPALRWFGRDGRQTIFTYAALNREANRFANVLTSLGVQPGDTVFSLLGRVPELYVAALGTLKAGCVFSPLFSAFGPEPVQSRMEIGAPEVLVTTAALYKRKVKGIRDRLPNLDHVLLVDGEDGGVHRPPALMAEAARRFPIAPTDPEDTALLHFTSGTTGRPKGAVHVHEAVVAHTRHGAARARPPARRRLLVHRRSRLGHRHVLRHHRAADQSASR